MSLTAPAVAISGGTGRLRRRLADLLREARERTLLLIAPLEEADLARQHDPLMGPILWDLGHIARFEELWLTRNLDGPVEFGEMPGLFNPFEHPRRTRGALALPSLAETLRTMAEIRERVLERLETADLGGDAPLLRDGYVYRMVLQHEYQHDETILQTLRLKQGAPYRAPRALTPPAGRRLADPGTMVRFPGGAVELGTDDRTVAYDNERPRHVVELAPFWIDAAPVTNADFVTFMGDGGYDRRELWSEAGWAWRTESGERAPKYWEWADGEWLVHWYDRTEPLALTHPVCHVCYYEAEAYARWAGKRLPTEAEWEAAATWDPAAGRKRTYPWGEVPPTRFVANLDQLAFETAAVGAYESNRSPIGAYGMIGDVWEWTASDFGPYPGYESFPYREYSEVFFGPEYKVLRGGSWATRPGAIRGTFRNWDYPVRRQIFSGFRCARDA
ncbi:MAG TPA: ergothioneine biosynthesis protein EgtB [Gemmatimonadales bacterium]|nr:ergothioneine biosynthesis protein EgtB [Gemmatimonadales bacterium]